MMLNVLIGCEFTGTIRDAFRRRGHNAWSCDLVRPYDFPYQFSKQPFSEYHLIGDIKHFIKNGPAKWDLMIASPPCTHLAVSGARWFKEKQDEQETALQFFRDLLEADIPHIALENPVSIASTKIRKPDQIIQPWWFGHGELKTTCLWLKRLPPLLATNIVKGREERIKMISPSKTRWMERSKFYPGIAEAMAQQWGDLLTKYYSTRTHSP